MSDKTVKRILSVIIGAGVVALWYVWINYSTKPTLEEARSPEAAIGNAVALYGSVEPQKSVNLQFENAGKIISVEKNVGDFVKMGAILAKEDALVTDAQLNQANAGVSGAQANLDSLQSILQREKYKLKSLKASDAASNDKKAQKSQIDSAESNVEAAQASLVQAQDAVKVANMQVEKRILRAPFDGIITKKNVEVGDLANPNLPNSSVMSIMAGNDASALEIDVFASEKDLSKLKVGDAASVTLDAFDPAVKFSAKISAIDPTQTVQNGASVYKVTLLLDQKDDRIKAGMSANAVVSNIQ